MCLADKARRDPVRTVLDQKENNNSYNLDQYETWTIDDTFYVLGTEGKRRKVRHPIEEFDPATGVRTPLGISLEDHPGIDSSL